MASDTVSSSAGLLVPIFGSYPTDSAASPRWAPASSVWGARVALSADGGAGASLDLEADGVPARLKRTWRARQVLKPTGTSRIYGDLLAVGISADPLICRTVVVFRP